MTYTQTQVFNKTSNSIGVIMFDDDFDYALLQTQPMNRDSIEVQEITIEMVKQGQMRIAGTNRYEDRMIRQVVATKVVKTGTVKVSRGTVTVIWQ